MKTLKQLSILTSLAAISLLTGCDIAEDTCTTDADCATGETCEIAEASGDSNVCVAKETCTTNADCAEGEYCDTSIFAEEQNVCVAAEASGDCTTDADCTAGQQCDNTSCVTIVYQHVAIVSRAVENANNHGNTPGPDIDAVAIKSGGVASFAAAEDNSPMKLILGRASDPEGNVNANRAAITGPNDAMTDTSGGTCDLAEGQGFFSLGYGDGPQGIVVLAMPNPIVAGDSIVVYEVGNGFCANVSVVREDSFDVYVGPLNADLAAITDLTSLVGQGFKLAGSQTAQNGGIFEFAAP